MEPLRARARRMASAAAAFEDPAAGVVGEASRACTHRPAPKRPRPPIRPVVTAARRPTPMRRRDCHRLARAAACGSAAAPVMAKAIEGIW